MTDGRRTIIVATHSMQPGQHEGICGQFASQVDLRMLDDRREALAAEAPDAEIVYGHLREEEIPHLPRLRWMHLPWTGVTGVLHEPLRQRGVIVTNTRGQAGYAMAEHCLAAILYLAREFSVYAATRGTWRPEIQPVRVEGSTALLLGTGALARVLIPKLRALGVRVWGLNTTGRATEGCQRAFTREDVHAALSEVDWVVVLLPGTPHTRHLVDETFLARLKPGAGLVNVGRGSVVDEAALLRCLDAERLRGAVLDVTDPEPPADDSPLWAHPRVLVTSHQSWMPPGGPESSGDVFRHNLECYLAGRLDDMRNVVDFDMGY